MEQAVARAAVGAPEIIEMPVLPPSVKLGPLGTTSLMVEPLKMATFNGLGPAPSIGIWGDSPAFVRVASPKMMRPTRTTGGTAPALTPAKSLGSLPVLGSYDF